MDRPKIKMHLFEYKCTEEAVGNKERLTVTSKMFSNDGFLHTLSEIIWVPKGLVYIDGYKRDFFGRVVDTDEDTSKKSLEIWWDCDCINGEPEEFHTWTIRFLTLEDPTYVAKIYDVTREELSSFFSCLDKFKNVTQIWPSK